MHTVAVGADIASAHFDAARLDAGGRYEHKRFSNDLAGSVAFLAWPAGFGGERPLARMEAAGAYSPPLAGFLFARGGPVAVANPARIAAFAKTELSRAKTDKADAKLVARFAREKQPPLWKPLPPALRALQSLLRRAEDLRGMLQTERNRLDAAEAARPIEAVTKALGAEMESVKARLRKRTDEDPDLRGRRDLLESIPGTGGAAAARLLAALHPHRGLASAKRAAAHAGLDVRIRDPGKRIGTRHLAKRGDPPLRKAPYMPALAAWRHNPAVKALCERLKAKGKNGKPVACAAMRKLLHLAFAILKSGKPFDPNYGLA